MGREEGSWGYIDREKIMKMINECLTEQFGQVLFYQSVFRSPRDTSNMVRKLKNKVFKDFHTDFFPGNYWEFIPIVPY